MKYYFEICTIVKIFVKTRKLIRQDKIQWLARGKFCDSLYAYPWCIADDTDYLEQQKNVEKMTDVISFISAQPILHCNNKFDILF